MGLIVAAILALSSPVLAAQTDLAPGGPGVGALTLAQAVDTDHVQGMSVSEVLNSAKKWELAIYGGASVLVFAFLLAAGLVRPGGFEKAGLRDVKGLPWAIWLFAAIVVLLAQQAAPVLLEQFGWWRENTLSDDQQVVVRSLAGALLGGATGIGMLYVMHKSSPESGLRLSPLDAPVGLGCFALAFPVVMLGSIAGVALHTQLAGEAPEAIAHPTLQNIVDWWQRSPGDPWLWGMLAAVVIGAPLVEEMIWRVFVQAAMIKLLKSPWVGILVTALGFALIHRLHAPDVAPVPWHALVPIFVLGLANGVGYERTKRVGVPITMHMCFNALMIAIALMSAPEAAQPAV